MKVSSILPYLPVRLALKRNTQSPPRGLRIHETADLAIYTFAWTSNLGRLILIPITLYEGVFTLYFVRLFLFGKEPVLVLIMSVNIMLLALSIVSFFNKTCLILTPDTIEVKSYPLSLTTRRRFDPREITQIRYKQRLEDNGRNRANMSYFGFDKLWVVTAVNNEQHLMNVRNKEVALYLAERIKYYFDIPNDIEVFDPHERYFI